MFLQMAMHSYMCQIYPLIHTPLLKIMVYLFLFIVGYMVWNWTSCWWCWANEEHDGNHSTIFLSKDINLSLWCSYGMFWFAGGGTWWATWPSNYGSCLATCFGFGIFATNVGHCEALEVDVVLVWYGMPWFMGWELFLTFASFFWS